MQIHYLSEGNSILNHFLGQIRNVDVQNDSMRFRRNIERIGEVMAYELSKNLNYEDIQITTPLGIKNTTRISDKLVLCSILRAGLPLHLGFLNYFDAAPEGIAYLKQHLPDNCHLWVATLDEKLSSKNYIVPGLGDAGDLAYGNKL